MLISLGLKRFLYYICKLNKFDWNTRIYEIKINIAAFIIFITQ